MAFIPEITTRVSVKANTENLDNSIELMESSSILSQCFGEVIEYLQNSKTELSELEDPTANAVADTLSAWQSAIIKTKHYVTGMMANSVDVMKDGDGVYMVGNTAMSVDGFPYPLAIEEGTVSHYVAPVTFKALHWIQNGEDRFSKGHYVSGITADPYVDYSIDNTEDEVEAIIMPYIERILGD